MEKTRERVIELEERTIEMTNSEKHRKKFTEKKKGTHLQEQVRLKQKI